MFKVKGEKLIRASSASTTQSRSGKASKMKSRPQKTNNPLIIVPESINEDDADKVIIENLATEMSIVEKKEMVDENNFFGKLSFVFSSTRSSAKIKFTKIR